MSIPELFARGGPAMWPLLLLSVLATGTILERIWFWSRILTREREVSGRVLEAARREWSAAAEIAERAHQLPMGRFLTAALKLQSPDPEVFRLALETAANEELTTMGKGDKVLEAVIGLSPLLGLLGTAPGKKLRYTHRVLLITTVNGPVAWGAFPGNPALSALRASITILVNLGSFPPAGMGNLRA